MFMLKINKLAIPITAVAAFAMSSVYYSPIVLGNVLRSVDPVAGVAMTPSPVKGLGEIARTVAITYVLAHLITLLGSTGWRQRVSLALWIWFGFSALMWAGAIMWEGTPWQVAAIHSGDWLLKTLLISVLLGMLAPKEYSHGERQANG